VRPLFARPGALDAIAGAIWIFDLDGVVVDVRKTYRRSYVEGLVRHLKVDCGLRVARGGTFTLEDAHRLKGHVAFNAPEHVAAFFLRASLAAAERHSGRTLDGTTCGLGEWIASALASGRLSQWRDALVADLDPAARARVDAREDLRAALACCHEVYAGSADVARIYGDVPRFDLPGLWRKDRLLLDQAIARDDPRVGVYTGRTCIEARWLMERFAMLRSVPEHALACTTKGAWKPDPEPLAALRQALGGGPLVYFGDLEADRQAALELREREPEERTMLVQIVERRAAPRWPEADVVALRPADALGASALRVV